MDTANREDLKDYFQFELKPLVQDKEIHSHLVEVLDGFIHDRPLPVGEITPDSIVINNLFEAKDFTGLFLRGDAYLFLCGWFPKYISAQRRKSLGMLFYIRKGKECYNYANYIANLSGSLGTSAKLLSKLSDYFQDAVCSLITLKQRLNENEYVSPSLHLELRNVFGYKDLPYDFRLINGGSKGPIETQSTDSLPEKMKRRNIRIIK